MAVITVGITPTDQGSSLGPLTMVEAGNVADGSGSIDEVEFWATSAMSGIEFASFSGASTVLSTNGVASVSGISGTGLQTYSAPSDFTAFNINAGERIGIHWTSGNIDRNKSGGGGYLSKVGDAIPCTSETFILDSDGILPLGASGQTAGGGTPVSNAASFNFDIRAVLSKEFIAVFDILSLPTEVSSNLLINFDVLNVLAKDVISVFDIRNTVASDLLAVFNTRQIIQSENTLNFDIRELSGSELIAVYDAGGSVNNELIMVFDLGDGHKALLLTNQFMLDPWG